MSFFRLSDQLKLRTLHPALAAVVELYAGRGGKFLIVTTTRGRAAQEQAKRSGHSNAHFGQSPHNYRPALGVDLGAVPYPGKETDYAALAKGMFAAADTLGTKIVWGGDWHSLKDFPHFELENWRDICGELAS